jgi:hypothetical protein
MQFIFLPHISECQLCCPLNQLLLVFCLFLFFIRLQKAVVAPQVWSWVLSFPWVVHSMSFFPFFNSTFPRIRAVKRATSSLLLFPRFHSTLEPFSLPISLALDNKLQRANIMSTYPLVYLVILPPLLHPPNMPFRSVRVNAVSPDHSPIGK